MSGGGGGGGNNQPQDNSIQLELMREAAADRAQAAADAKTAQDKTDFQKNLGDAVSGAKSTGTAYLGQRGLSSDTYGSIIDSIINDTKLKVPQLDANPAGYFTNDTFASGLDNYQTMQRNNYNANVNSTFAPGFEKSLLPSTADDSIINSILGTQQSSAQQQLDFNRKRGLLNDAGYNEANAELGRQASAGRSTLNGIGESVLGTDWQGLNDIKGNAGSVASNYTLGQSAPDIMSFYTQAKDKAAGYSSNLEGDIRSALGSTNLFDVPTAIGKGGTAQGPINLTTADAAPGLPTIQKKTANRGLGSTGVF